VALTRAEVEDALAAAGRAPDARFPMFEAALSCALHENAARDAERARRLVAEGQARLSDRLPGERPEDALCEALAGDLHLTGDLLTPDDPANADLIAVCDRRLGLSIALGVIYLETGRRAGLKLSGVDFPGHFLLRVETDMPSELTRRALSTGLMPGVADRLDALMAPAADRAVILRLQSLIFTRAMQAGEFERAERAAFRCGLLSPQDHRPWLDVAAAREGQGRLAGTLEALDRARSLGGAAAGSAVWARERVRRQLN
jgi:regulator of sirC expression with transglutaminase-like and TPR domain